MVVENFHCNSFECHNRANYQCKNCTLEAHYCSRVCQKSHWGQSHKKAHELWDILHLINITKNETVKQSINTSTNNDQDEKREKSEEEKEKEEEIKKRKISTEDLIDLSKNTNILLRLPNEILDKIRSYLGKEKGKLSLLTKDMHMLFFSSIKHITVKYKTPWEDVIPIIVKDLLFLESIHIEADDKFDYSFIKLLFPKDSELRITKLSIRFNDMINEDDWFLDYLNNNIPLNLKKHIETIEIREDYFEFIEIIKRINKKPFKNINRFEEFTNLTKLVLNNLRALNFTCDILSNLFSISKQLKDIKLIKIIMTDGCYKQLSQFKQLEHLTLRFKYMFSIPDNIKTNINYLNVLNKIKYLSLSNVIFDFNSKMKFLKTMTTLQVLKLKNFSNHFKYQTLQDEFFKSLSTLKNIKEISLKNHILVRGTFLKYLKQSNQFKVLKIIGSIRLPLKLIDMKNIGTIEEIDLSVSNLREINIFEDMSKTWDNLKILNLKKCNLKNEQITKINKILPKLIHLDISENKELSFIKVKNIIFKYMPMLEYLNVTEWNQQNFFRNIISIKEIITHLTKLKTLYIDLHGNFISDEDIKKLLQWLKENRPWATIKYNLFSDPSIS